MSGPRRRKFVGPIVSRVTWHGGRGRQRSRWALIIALASGLGHHQSRLALADALALEESGPRLDGVSKRSHGPVEVGGARLHLQDREDASVGLDEGDVERGG